MFIVESLAFWLQVFFLEMTEPTGGRLIRLISGWIWLPGRSLADRVRAAGEERSASSFYRLLSAARWSMDEVGWRVLRLLLRWHPQETLLLVGDDTLLPRKGAQVFGAGLHRDPCLSSRRQTIKRWGNCWVVLSAVLASRHDPAHTYCLPILMRLHLSRAAAQKHGRAYRSKSELMIEMLSQVEERLGQQKLHFLGDYGYTAPALLARIPRRIEVTGRANRRARLHAPAPPRTLKRGRPRVRGERLPSPEQMLKPVRRWRTLKVSPSRRYRVRLASQVGCFYQTPRRQIKLVTLEHRGGRENDVFYSTVLSAGALQIAQWYSQRVGIETTFHDCKQHLAVGAEHNRASKAVERTAPLGFLLYSVIVLWHEARPTPVASLRSYPGKRHPSLADMLAALRRETIAQHRRKYFGDSALPPQFEKTLNYLENLLALSA